MSDPETGDTRVSRTLRAGTHTLELGTRTLVMGVLNVTPDSFSGDGTGDDVAAAVARAQELVRQGADVVDIGGESTRPNSAPVDAEEEARRVLPVLVRLQETLGVPVSIDTRKAVVARAAIEYGATIINDIWGLRGDGEMRRVVAEHREVALVVMHNQRGVAYGDVLADVVSGLQESLDIADAAGIERSRIVVDPGFGFAKSPAHNLEIVRRLHELRVLDRPILVGPSRKSTIGFLTHTHDMQDRLPGSLAMAAMAVAHGADMVRVHDVAETVSALRVVDAVVRGTPAHVEALPPPGPTG